MAVYILATIYSHLLLRHCVPFETTTDPLQSYYCRDSFSCHKLAYLRLCSPNLPVNQERPDSFI